MNLLLLLTIQLYVMIVQAVDCTAEESNKVYPYVFGLNQTVTNKTNNSQDTTNGLIDVNIENIITDSSLNTYVAVTASSKCYF